MNFKQLIEKYGVMIICMGTFVWWQVDATHKQSEYLSAQVDILQDKVSFLQAQVGELNDNFKWMRTQRYK